MGDHGASDFGKDVGLVHEAIITGRKVGADREFWARLAHDEEFFRKVFSFYEGNAEVKAEDKIISRILATNFLPLLGSFIHNSAIYCTDPRTTALTQIDFTKVNLETCLSENDGGFVTISGEEKLSRLKEGGNIRLGAETFLALWLEKGHKTLEWLFKEKGVCDLDFFGTIFMTPSDRLFVLILKRRNGHWYKETLWLDQSHWGGWNYAVTLAAPDTNPAPPTSDVRKIIESNDRSKSDNRNISHGPHGY